MNFTFSSLFSAIIFNNFLIVIIYCMLKNCKFIINIGIKLLLFCIVLVTIRFFLPFELFFMKSVPVTKILPQISAFITETTFTLMNKNISIIEILTSIWIIGIIFISIKVVFNYYIFKNKLKKFALVTEQNIIDILNRINYIYNSNATFRVVYNDELESPFIFGLKSPTIVIPEIELTEDNWFYILNHEIAHYYNKDLFYKMFAEMLSILYWWNSFIYLLKSQIVNLLEINIDFIVTQPFDDEKKLSYLECLLNMIRICNKNHVNCSAIGFQNYNQSIISQRINIILAHVKGTKPIIQLIALIASIVITFMACSFCFIFEPYAIPLRDANNTFKIEDYDTYYMLENGDGSFDLYLNSKYIATVYEIFDSNIRIYK